MRDGDGRSKHSPGNGTMRTPVDKRARRKSMLKAPFSSLPNVQWSSWKDQFLPNMLWACALAGNLKRDTYLEIFRSVAATASDAFGDDKDSTLGHNYLSTTDFAAFNAAFRPLIDIDECRPILRALASVEVLPDIEHWRLVAEPEAEFAGAFEILANAVAATLDHQSEAATDVRWIKVAFFMISGRMHFADGMAEQVENIWEFPNKGDLRSVRPSIRAAEMVLRQIECGEQKPERIPNINSEDIWRYFYDKSKCIIGPERKYESLDLGNLFREVVDISEALRSHYFQNQSSTLPNPRLEGAIGIALSACSILGQMCLLKSDRYQIGRFALRVVFEAFIIIKGLT